MLRAMPALCLFVCLKTVKCEALGGKDNGLGNGYVWASSLESGMQLAKQHRKPLMLIIHKSTCGACQRLKPKFAASSEIQDDSFLLMHSTGKDNGLCNGYVWAGSLESGKQLAKQHHKPLMLIIHKSTCGACQRLKPKFAASSEIQSLSQHFVMVNVMDDDEPEGKRYAPDGAYIPRILFITPRGEVDKDIYNEAGSDAHRYFYSRPEHIAAAMARLLAKYDRPEDSHTTS